MSLNYAVAQIPRAEGFVSSLGLLIVAVTVTASVMYFGWVLRSIMRAGQRVESRAFGVFEVVVATSWLALFGLMALLPQGQTNPGIATAESRGFSIDQLLTFAGLNLLLYAIPLALLLQRRHDLVMLFGLNNLSLTNAIAWAVASLCAFYPILGIISVIVTSFAGGPLPEQQIMQMMRATTGSLENFLFIIFAVIMAPLCEEFFFRGLFYGAAKRFLGFPLAALVSALAFAAVHAHLPALFPLTALGVVLVLVYERTGSLIVPMAMHSFFNAATLVASRYFPAP